VELVETHATKLAGLQGDMDLETHSYTEYRQNVHHWLRELHEVMASSFNEVHARCLPFPGKGAKVEEMIKWVAGEVKTVPDTVWQLNDNFTVLAVEGILSMLNNEGCQLGHLHDWAASSDVAILQNVLEDVRKLAGRLVWRWWKPNGLHEALRRLEVANAMTVSDAYFSRRYLKSRTN
jgi:hypothetical protein